MPSSGDKPDVLQLTLSRYHSLDVVRLPKARKYRVVLAERFGVQRRAFVEISFDEAAKLALFQRTASPMRTILPRIRTGHRSSRLWSCSEMAMPRTRSRNVTGDAVPRLPDSGDD